MQALPSLWTSITRGRNVVMRVEGTEGHEIVKNWIVDRSTVRNFMVNKNFLEIKNKQNKVPLWNASIA